MTENNDWRIRNQLDYLYGLELVKTKYNLNNQSWEHDHCEFCWMKINSEEFMGYSTKDGYYWICKDCFNDFLHMFKWIVISK